MANLGFMPVYRPIPPYTNSYMNEKSLKIEGYIPCMACKCMLPLVLRLEGPFRPHNALSQGQNWTVQCLPLLLSLLLFPQQPTFIKLLLFSSHCLRLEVSNKFIRRVTSPREPLVWEGRALGVTPTP